MKPAQALLLAILAVGTHSYLQAAEDPPVPRVGAKIMLENDDKPIRVALLDSGVNYLLPAINHKLARDSDGNLIGYDFWDMDARPFDAHPDKRGTVSRHGTRTASLLLKEAPFVELVPYRYPRPDMTRMKALVAHAAAHDVRIMGMPLGGNLRDQWMAFESAAKAHPNILFIASAGNNGRDIDDVPVYPASLDLDNMLVVTSADDFARLAQGVNWGRRSVDYLLPAEHQWVTRFDGTSGQVSGSSYAVPRLAALAARFLHNDGSLSVSDLKSRIRNQFANGSWPARIAQGYIHDPQFDAEQTVQIHATETWSSESETANGVRLPFEVLVLDSNWVSEEIHRVLEEADRILAQCDLMLSPGNIKYIHAPEYLRDLETGAAKTLMQAVRSDGPDRKLTVVLARDTLMSMPFDAEAFGHGNTRHRPWLTGSVWLTLALQDRSIALAHELFHVLVNSGEHSTDADNLMLSRTTGTNTGLSESQCENARAGSVKNGWVIQ